MNIKRFNWQIWAGFVLTLVAGFSFPFFFVNFPLTRDFPWVNLLLFAVAAALLFVGLKRAFARPKSEGGPKRSTFSKIVASGLATLSVLIIGLFLFSFFIMAKWLPPSTGAPSVGQKAPEFTLSDANGKTVSLSELISSPIPAQANASAPKGVLLIFYRGYW